MKKILVAAISVIAAAGVAGIAIAQTAPNIIVNPTTATPAPKAEATLNIACLQTAVTTRETAIDAAFDAFTASNKSALDKRKTDLVAAWGITTKKERNAARNKAWADFRLAKKAANQTLRAATKSAWDAFATEGRTSCKTDVSGIEPQSFDTTAVPAIY